MAVRKQKLKERLLKDPRKEDINIGVKIDIERMEYITRNIKTGSRQKMPGRGGVGRNIGNKPPTG